MFKEGPMTARKIMAELIKRSVLFIITYLVIAAASYGGEPPKSVQKPSSHPQSPKMDAGSWGKIVAAAKKEGKIVIAGPPSNLWERPFVDMFREAYPDIAVEYSGFAGRDLEPRLRKETLFFCHS